ncbi:MAG: hypothetical protein AAFN79_17810 [Pseudomonadota bacterium]
MTSEARSPRALMAAVAAVIAAQVVLVFKAPINWDEYLHFSQIVDLAEGRLQWGLQTLHARLLAWVLWVPGDAIAQIQAARLAALACSAATTGFVVLLAARFVDRWSAWLAGLAYIAGGYVFAHAFAVRPDPFATAALMGALCLLAIGRLSALRMAAAGILIGLAGAMTIKSVFFAPCFAGVALMRAMEAPDGPWRRLAIVAIAPLVAGLVFAATVTAHGADASGGENGAAGLSRRAAAFLADAPLLHARYAAIQFLLTPLVTFGVVATAMVWRRLSPAERFTVVGLLAPLATLLFYRNTFPYYFAFLYAPVCVAIAPSLALIGGRLWRAAAPLAAIAGAVVLLLAQKPIVLDGQRMLLGEINRLFGEEVAYLSHVPFAPRHERILPHFLSGPGLARYLEPSDPAIARRIEAGEVGFVLADSPALKAALIGDAAASPLPLRDVEALSSRFISHDGMIWIYGRVVCPAEAPVALDIARAGPFAADGGALEIDGARIEDGASVVLERGAHLARAFGPRCVALWALPEPPGPPGPSFRRAPVVGFFGAAGR